MKKTQLLFLTLIFSFSLNAQDFQISLTNSQGVTSNTSILGFGRSIMQLNASINPPGHTGVLVWYANDASINGNSNSSSYLWTVPVTQYPVYYSIRAQLVDWSEYTNGGVLNPTIKFFNSNIVNVLAYTPGGRLSEADNINEVKVNLFPNPSTTNIRIANYVKGGEFPLVSIVSAQGNVVKDKIEIENSLEETEIDVKELVSGTYFLTLTYKSEVHLVKFIKQ